MEKINAELIFALHTMRGIEIFQKPSYREMQGCLMQGHPVCIITHLKVGASLFFRRSCNKTVN